MSVYPVSGDKSAPHGYSEYWRCNKSALEAQELACVLRALRKVGAYITSNMKPVEWAGPSAQLPDLAKKEILLDISLAAGRYPVLPWKMDRLVALVAREAFRCRELSDLAWVFLEQAAADLTVGHRYLLHQLADVGEDVYIRHVSCGTVWEYYLDGAWEFCRPRVAREYSLPPTARSLFQVWADCCLTGRLPENLHFEYERPLRCLLSHTEEIHGCSASGSLTERCRKRSAVYLKMWREVMPFIAEWETELPPENKGVDILDERGRKKPLGKFEREQDSAEMEGIPVKEEKKFSDLARDVKRLMEEQERQEKRDLDREVRIVCGEKTSGVMETVFTNAASTCKTPPDPFLVKRLRRTFELQKSKDRELVRINRGLINGRIDGRRLHRAFLDGKLFRRKEFSEGSGAWNITILVDASASMKGTAGTVSKNWRIVEKTFVSLYEAARGSGNTLNVFAYFEGGARCQISRLLYNNRLYSVMPNGRTPTGQAIIASVLLTPDDKRRLIVHITDGEPNCGASVDEALKFCAKEGVELVTIGCYYDKDEVKDMFQRQYGDRAYLMDSLDHLPEGLDSLLRSKLLAGRKK